MSERILVSDVVKEYPDMLRIYIYHNSYPLNATPKSDRPKREVRSERKAQKKEESTHRSIRRSRSVISDIVLSNNFDYWCTFTFNPKNHDRFDISSCKSTMSTWLHRQKSTHSPDLEYLIVPELHKRCKPCVDGSAPVCLHPDAPKAVHFHAMLKNFNGRLKDSKKRTSHNQIIYNLSGYRAGFSTAVPIDENTGAVSAYLQKYITKDMLLFDNKKRYWCSRGLVRPTSTVNGVAKFGLQKIIFGHKPKYINEFYEIQEHSKQPNIPMLSHRDRQMNLL